jgi:hypothetical protein
VAVVQYTFTHKQYTEQHKNKQYIEQHKNIGSLVRAVPHLCGFYPGICLTTEEKHGKTPVKEQDVSTTVPEKKYAIKGYGGVEL